HDRVDSVSKARMRDGTRERIYRKWGIWDSYQPAFFENALASQQRPTASREPRTADRVVVAYLPALLRASIVTVILSCAAMALAIIVGILLASGRVYGNVLVRSILTTYVEVVRGTPAFRLALAPMTNDFVALLKDSSLVSVITVVELTKQTQIFAANIGSWVIPGALCAALYLLLSLPLSRLAGKLEARWKAPTS